METQNPTHFGLLAHTAALLLFCPAAAHAQGGVPLWTNRYEGPANGDDRALAIAVDKSGNALVAGTSEGRYLTIKYSSAGALLWTNLYDGPVNLDDVARAIALDDSGNAFVAGFSRDVGGYTDFRTIKYATTGDLLWINDGLVSRFTSGFAIAVDSSGNACVTGESGDTYGSTDYATIKYSNTGDLLWTNFYNGPTSGRDSASAIALDSSGNVFVTGTSQNSTGPPFIQYYATVAYSNSGVPLWTNRYGGSANARAIVVDNSGNVFVAGSSDSRGSLTYTNDYATIKYSNAGVPLWTNRYGGTANGNDEAVGIAADRSGNVFVAGYSVGSGSSYDYATIKYSSAGVPLWTNRYNGPGNGDDFASAIALDSGGNVFVTGRSFNNGNYDMTTLAYSNLGVPLWTNRYNGPGNSDDYASAIAVDSSGNVFLTGTSYDTNGSSEAVAIKYSSSVPPPRLDFQLLNNQLVLSWTNAGFNLQSAPSITGPFTNLAAATSPYTNPLTAPQQFFRLEGN